MLRFSLPPGHRAHRALRPVFPIVNQAGAAQVGNWLREEERPDESLFVTNVSVGEPPRQFRVTLGSAVTELSVYCLYSRCPAGGALAVPTPSAAAEIASTDQRLLKAQLSQQWQRISSLINQQYQWEKQRFQQLIKRLRHFKFKFN